MLSASMEHRTCIGDNISKFVILKLVSEVGTIQLGQRALHLCVIVKLTIRYMHFL